MQHRLIRPPRSSRLALGIGAMLIPAVLAGCGHGAAAGSASTSASATKGDPLRFSQCMREHGINFPDPQSNGNGGFSLRVNPGSGAGQINPDDPRFQQAQNACKGYLPNGGQLSPEQQAQAQQNGLAFARCMRAHGVDVPDPQTDGNGGFGLKIQGGTGPGQFNPDDPKFQQAQQACSKYLGAPGSGGPQFSTGG